MTSGTGWVVTRGQETDGCRGYFFAAVLGAALMAPLVLKQRRKARETQNLVQDALASAKVELDEAREQAQTTREELDEVRERTQAAQERLEATNVELDEAREWARTTQEELDEVRERAQTTQEKLEAAKKELERKLATAVAFIGEAAKRLDPFALKALGKVGDRGSLDVMAILSEAIQDYDPGVRVNVLNLLGEVAERGSPEAMAIIRVYARERNHSSVRSVAVRALGQVGDCRSKETMAIATEALTDDYGIVRESAAQALQQLAAERSSCSEAPK